MLIDDVVGTIRPLAERNANTVKVHYDEGIGYIHADLVKLRQVLLNLLSNAAKFTENGVITLEVTSEEATSGQPPTTNGNCDESLGAGIPDQVGARRASLVVFRVRDTGIGMTAEQQQNLFQEFAQADNRIAHKYGGTGLGLALSQRLCTLMGGAIDVLSAPGQGATFTVHLPLTETMYAEDFDR